MKNDINLSSESERQKNLAKKQKKFVDVMKVKDENSRIRIH
jgi:hypothetical protein